MRLEEVVEQLKKALTGAKAKILELKGLLDVLTAQPLVHASVVAVRPPEEPKNAPPEAFTVGTRVVIVAGRGGVPKKFFGTTGTVIEDDRYEHGRDYDVRVRCDIEDGPEFYFSVGRKADAFSSRRSPVELKLPGRPGGITVVHEGKRFDLQTPHGFTVRVGDTVSLSTKTMQIVEVAKDPAIGETVIVRKVLDASTAEVDWQGGTRVVVNAPDIGKVRKGDRVVLDPSGSALVRNLGKEDERFAFRAQTNVSWDDIGGLAQAKAEMVEAVEYPVTERELYTYYNQKPIKGVLLFGPPRCGKTMLGKATATAQARIHGRDASKALFLYVKGPEILDKYVGVAEGAVRYLFATLRNHRAEHGVPGVLFVDEADAIMYKRGTGISSDIERTIVPAFLAEMDGLEDAAGLVLLATNRPDVLDPAVIGDGRVDRRVYVNRPDREAAERIFDIYFRKARLSPKTDAKRLTALAAEEMFRSSRVVREVVVKNGSVTTIPLTLAHIINGAMIENIVNRATSNAIARDRATRRTTGVTEDDVLHSVTDTFRSTLALNHDDDILDLVERLPQGTRLVGTRRVSAPATA